MPPSDELAEHMEYEYLDALRKKHPAWRLLASPQASFTGAFFYRTFIAPNRRAIGEQELIGRLDEFLYMISQGEAEPVFPRTPKAYLDAWADDEHGWLRKFYPTGQDEPHFDLTSSAQKAVEWLLGLRQQSFVGTESRLLTVFDLLQQIVERSEEDPALRLAELERRKAEVEQEMVRVQNGQVDLLDDTQVRERFWQAMTTAREILADFRAVEQNFRELDRAMRERIATWKAGKGELLSVIFEERDGIAFSEQGKSFAAFWRFLMSSAYQEHFQNTLGKVLALPAVQELGMNRQAGAIHYDWMDAGAHVQETVAALSQQLRRYVDENFLAEERRIVHLAREAEGHALAVRQAPPPPKWQMEIDAPAPDISLAMDRPLFSPPVLPEIRDDSLAEGQADMPVDALFSQVYVDKERLRDQIRQLLQARAAVSLREVIDRFPVELGLTEIVSYLVIASEDNLADFSSEETERLVWRDETGKAMAAKAPKIIFHRSRVAVEQGGSAE